jgi:branched-subunit amino acid transport protein
MVVDWNGMATDFATPRVAAALLAAGVAYFTRSTLKTLGSGMAALWMLQWVWA